MAIEPHQRVKADTAERDATAAGRAQTRLACAICGRPCNGRAGIAAHAPLKGHYEN